MRQLVSVVTDESIAYLVHDGEHTVQIAQVLNVGLDVPSVITLGVNLGDVLRLPTMRLNGSAERAVEQSERRALPPAKTTAKRYKLKADEPVECRVCGRALTRRHGYAPHLQSVHNWRKQDALLEARTCRSTDPNAKTNAEIDSAISASGLSPALVEDIRRGPKRRRVGERHRIADTWPNASTENVFKLIEQSGERGTTVRDLAEALTDRTQRGRQTIGNRLQTLRGQGVIVQTHEMRPHPSSGNAIKTMVVRARR